MVAAPWVVPALCIIAAVHVVFSVAMAAARWSKRRPAAAATEHDLEGYLWS